MQKYTPNRRRLTFALDFIYYIISPYLSFVNAFSKYFSYGKTNTNTVFYQNCSFRLPTLRKNIPEHNCSGIEMVFFLQLSLSDNLHKPCAHLQEFLFATRINVHTAELIIGKNLFNRRFAYVFFGKECQAIILPSVAH